MPDEPKTKECENSSDNEDDSIFLTTKTAVISALLEW